MSREEIILYPDDLLNHEIRPPSLHKKPRVCTYLVYGSQYGVLRVDVEIGVCRDGVYENVLDITQENGAMDVLHSQSRLLRSGRPIPSTLQSPGKNEELTYVRIQ